MRPATDALPKPMLPVRGKPLLEHQLSWLKASGLTQIQMCLGYKAEAVTGYFGDGSKWGVQLSYHVEKEPRGTAGCLKDAGLTRTTLVVYGDLFVELDAGKLLDFHRKHGAEATLVLRRTDHPQDSDLARLEGWRVKEVARGGSGDLGLAAVWVVEPALMDLVSSHEPSDFGRDVFPAALKAGRVVAGYVTAEKIVDLGTPERLERFS
jgi:NDP-sugar pyrophosphorylase family protein